MQVEYETNVQVEYETNVQVEYETNVQVEYETNAMRCIHSGTSMVRSNAKSVSYHHDMFTTIRPII